MGVAGHKLLIDNEAAQKKKKLCERAWVPYVLESFGVSICFAAFMSRDGAGEVYRFGCGRGASFQLQREASCRSSW